MIIKDLNRAKVILRVSLKDNLSTIRIAFQTVFQSKKNIVLALILALVVLLFSIWLPNLELVGKTILSSKLDFEEKLLFLFSSLAMLKSNFSLFSASLTILISILFGINVVLIVSYFRIRKQIANQKILGTSFLGIFSGFLGIGCAACGSVILSSILGTAATFGFIAKLPFRGQEFGILAVFLLLFSILTILKRINNAQCNSATKSNGRVGKK